MPAISADTVALPGLPDLDPTAADRPVVSVTTAPSGLEGEGFPVRRAFAGVDLGALDPFVHMDQMGEADYAPGEPKGTPWHPHRGFETATYMLDGVFQHQDSNGRPRRQRRQAVQPGSRLAGDGGHLRRHRRNPPPGPVRHMN
jgi:quercetin 2,3-dioxygenase